MSTTDSGSLQSKTLYFHSDSLSADEPDSEPEEAGTGVGGDQRNPGEKEQKDEWNLATRYQDIQRFGYIEPKKKLEMSKKAIHAIMTRAKEMLGPVQKPYRYEHANEERLLDLAHQNPHAELDIEETLIQHSGGKLEPIYRVRLEKEHGLVLVLDTSLSMKGEQLALLGVTVAAVSFTLPPESFSVMGFDSEIHAIKRFEDRQTVEESVEKTLSIPPGGFTNLELALKNAQKWVSQSAYPRARVILVSDGRYTEGKSPIELAKKLPFIFSVKLGKNPSGRSVMKDIADTGLGRFTEVREMEDLPKVLLNAVRTWVR